MISRHMQAEKKGRKEQEERARKAENDRKRVQDENRETTLAEYLYNCHFHLYTKLGLADKSKSSTGFTKVEGKYYPRWLRPWDNFASALRQRHFEVIRRVCGERRLFYQDSTTRNQGTTISRKLAGTENTISRFETLAVEDPVWEIISSLGDEEGIRTEYQFTGFQFSNNIREFTQPSDGSLVAEEDPSEERPERRRRTGPNKRVASERRVKLPLTKPDG